MHKFGRMNKTMAASCCCAIAVLTAAAQSAFVCQYDGMNETNRVEVKSVKVSGANRTLTWTADRDYPQCGVGSCSATSRSTWRSIPTIPATSAWQTRSSRPSIRSYLSNNNTNEKYIDRRCDCIRGIR